MLTSDQIPSSCQYLNRTYMRDASESSSRTREEWNTAERSNVKVEKLEATVGIYTYMHIPECNLHSEGVKMYP